MDQWWSWALGIIGLIGFHLAGQKVWWCWYINIANQILWFAYSLVTGQYGFLVATFGYMYVFVRNAIKWTKDHRDPFRKMDLNEYTHLQKQLASDKPALDSFSIDVNYPFKHTITLNMLDYYDAEHVMLTVESEKENWIASLPASYRFHDVTVYREDDFTNPNNQKFTFELSERKPKDNRECGWMGCGDPRCIDVCKGVRNEKP